MGAAWDRRVKNEILSSFVKVTNQIRKSKKAETVICSSASCFISLLFLNPRRLIPFYLDSFLPFSFFFLRFLIVNIEYNFVTILWYRLTWNGVRFGGGKEKSRGEGIEQHMGGPIFFPLKIQIIAKTLDKRWRKSRQKHHIYLMQCCILYQMLL